MKIRKFMIIGMASLLMLSGCGKNAQTLESDTQVEQETASTSTDALETAALRDQATLDEADPKVSEASETPAEGDTAKAQIKMLAELMGKTSHEVHTSELGKPETTVNVAKTQLIAADYYKIDFLGEVVKLELDYDVDSQKVNYISFTLLAADEIDATKKLLADTLTELYGEPTIERYVDVKGKQRQDWYDGNIDFDLRYYENNISLDIYTLDK